MYSRTSKQSRQYARKMGWEVDPAEENELQLDIDTEEQYNIFNRMLPLVEDVYDIEEVVESPSKSGKRHIRLFTAYELSIGERIALQTILGSDPKKELASLRNWLAGDPEPILLFEKSNAV